MNAIETILYDLKMTNMIVTGYLGDLTQDDFLVRPVEKANHITWQVGHLLKSTSGLAAASMPGKLPELPEGFGDRYTAETASSDELSDFDSRDELMSTYEAQHKALCEGITTLSEEELNAPMPENLERLGKTAIELIAFQPIHWMMHAGQWAIIRRKLGKEPLF